MRLKNKQDLKYNWKENVDKILYQGLFSVLEVICIELISWHYNNLLEKYFGIKKIWELIVQNHY